MKILVTGADGFIGKYLVSRLINEGHSVVCHIIEDGDISEKNILDKYSGIEYIYHLAAKTFVPDSWINSYDYIKTNVLGTLTVLEYARKYGCRVSVLSTYVYGKPQYLPVDEIHPIKGISPYHESKIMAEKLCEFYSEKYNIQVTIFRPFNVYGYGQNESFLLPKIFKQVLDADVKEINVMDLEPKRDYIYILDVIEALLCGLKSKKSFEVYNIGSGISLSVKEVIDIINKITNINKPYNSTNKYRKDEVLDCVADINKLIQDFNFYPKFTFKKGIDDWLKIEKLKHI